MMTYEAFRDALFALARENGAEAETYCVEDESFRVRIDKQEVDTYTVSRGRGLGLRVRLPDAGNRGGNVEVDGLGLLHEDGQFTRTETAPPVQRRRLALGVTRRCLVGRWYVQRRVRQVGREDAAARHGRQSQRRAQRERRPRKRSTSQLERQLKHRRKHSPTGQNPILQGSSGGGQGCSIALPKTRATCASRVSGPESELSP